MANLPPEKQRVHAEKMLARAERRERQASKLVEKWKLRIAELDRKGVSTAGEALVRRAGRFHEGDWYALLMNASVIEPARSATFAVEIAVGCLLFDMDGVLVSSTSTDERCWTRWAARHLPGQPFDLKRTHGRRAADTIQDHFQDHFQTLDRAAIDAHLAELDALAGEEQSGITAYPGARDLLAGLPPYRWTVVTSASEKMMRSRLASVGIPAPSQVVAGDMVAHGKPDPECYLKGAALLCRLPEECLVIEDSPAGIRAANAAGCKVLAVATSHRAEELRQADWIVARLADIEVRIDETATLNLSFPALVRGTESVS